MPVAVGDKIASCDTVGKNDIDDWIERQGIE